jgi:hypothetical protein
MPDNTPYRKLPVRKKGESDSDYYARWSPEDYELLNQQILEAELNYETLNKRFLDEKNRANTVTQKALEIARELGYNDQQWTEEQVPAAKGLSYRYDEEAGEEKFFPRMISLDNPQDWEAIGMDFVNDPTSFVNNLKQFNPDPRENYLYDWDKEEYILDEEGNKQPTYQRGMGCIGAVCGIYNTAGATQVSDFPTGFGNNIVKAGDPIFKQMSNKFLDENDYAGMKAMGFVQTDNPNEGSVMRIAEVPGSPYSSHSMIVNRINQEIGGEDGFINTFDWDARDNVIENPGSLSDGIKISHAPYRAYNDRASYWNYVGNTPQYEKEANTALEEFNRLRDLKSSSFVLDTSNMPKRIAAKPTNFQIITRTPNVPRTWKEKRQQKKIQAAADSGYPYSYFFRRKKYGGAMAPNIPTWDYPSKGTPIYRDTTDAPPRMFDNGGKTKDKRKAINQRIHDVSNYISNYEWNPDGTPVTYEQRLKDYYDSLADYFNNQKVITTANKNKSLTDRRKYKKFIKNTMDDIYKISEEDYVYSNIPNQKYNIATGSVDKEFSPQEGFDDYIRIYSTADATKNPTLLEKWKQRRNKAQMMNHVLAELQGYGELPEGYNDEDWANYVDTYEKAIANAKNYQAYKQAKKDVKGKGKGRYKGSDGTRKFLDDYKANNWAQFDNQNVKEDFPGQWQMSVDADTEEKRQNLSALNTMLYEGAMLGTGERVLAEPGRTVVDFNNTIGDLITAPFVEGDINPYSYNYDTGQRGVPYWEGAQGAMDATIVGSMAFPYLRGISAATSRTPGVTQAGFGRFRLGQPKATKVKVTPQQAEKLKKLNFTDDQIENFGTYFPEADSAFIDDFIKTEEAIKSTAAKAKKGTPTDTPEEIVNYNSSIDEIKQNTPIEVNESTPIEEIIADSPNTQYLQGYKELEVEAAGVKAHKDAYIQKIIDAHPGVDPNKIKTAINDLRGESATKTFTKKQIKEDPEISFLVEKPKNQRSEDIVMPYEDKAIYADFALDNPNIFPRNPKAGETVRTRYKDNLDLLEETAKMTTGEGKMSLTPEQEILTSQFVHGYYVPYNYPGKFPLFKGYGDRFNKLITQKGNQIAEPMVVTRADREFFIPELGKYNYQLTVGDEFTIPKFQSTTVGPEKSMFPYTTETMFGDYTSSIKLPTGQSIYIPGKYPSGQSFLHAELEGVLPRNLKFKVDKVNTPFEQGLREIKDITKENFYLGSQEYLPSPSIKIYDQPGKQAEYFMLNEKTLPFEVNQQTEAFTKAFIPGTTNRDFFLRKSKIPFSNKYYFIDKPTFAGRQDWLNRLKSKYKTKKVSATETEVSEFLKDYNKFKEGYPEKPNFEFSILNPYRRGGYLNKKYKYGGFSR